jgi:glutathione synthase/RimK-type ligase-like ATP-grasp enzyme
MTAGRPENAPDAVKPFPNLSTRRSAAGDRRDTVLMISSRDDGHVDVVAEELRNRSVPVIRFEPDSFPCRATLSYTIDPAGHREILSVGGATYDLGSVRSVWYKRPAEVAPPRDLAAQDLVYAYDQCSKFVTGVWGALADRFWINPPAAGWFANHKPAQLVLAQRLGFTVPVTLMTNDPDDLVAFAEARGGEFIFKPFAQFVGNAEEGRLMALYTNRLTIDRITNLEGLRITPGIFQENITKRVEVRATVIGDRVLAAEIHSQQSERSKDDWRRYDVPNTPYLPHELPSRVEQMCRDLVRTLGLCFGCIDLILTPSGDYVFLEINPEGQWYWIEQLTGMPLLDSFVEMLIQARPDYVTGASSALQTPFAQ